MDATPQKPKYTLTFMDLLIAFATPRHDHPGRKSGCDFRRGSYSGKICRTKKK